MSDNKSGWVPTVMDQRDLKLYAEHPLVEGGYKPEFAVKWIQKTNAFSVKVSTGTKTEKGYPITVETAIGVMSYLELMELIETVASAPGPVSFEMDNWGQPFIWSKEQGKSIRSPDILNVSRFQVAKREDGSIVLSVAAKGKKEMEFEFKGSDFHRIQKNGQADKSMASRIAARTWAGFWKKFAQKKYEDSWQETEYDKNKRIERMNKANGNNGSGRNANYNSGGNTGGGGGNNNYNQRPQQSAPQQSAPAPAPQQSSGNPAPSFDSFDDDIPF